MSNSKAISPKKFLKAYLGPHAKHISVKPRRVSCHQRLRIGNEDNLHTDLAPSTLRTLERIRRRSKLLAIDTETSMITGRMFAFSLCNEHGDHLAIRKSNTPWPCIACKGQSSQLSRKSLRIPQLWRVLDCKLCAGQGVAPQWAVSLWILRRLAEDPRYVKLFHNAKFDLSKMELEDIHAQGTIHCTMLMHYSCDPRRPHGLKPIAKNKLKEDIRDESILREWVRSARSAARAEVKASGFYYLDGEIQLDPDIIGMEHAPWKIVKPYADKDAIRCMMVFHYCRPGIRHARNKEVYLREMRLMPYVRQMELKGMRWDMDMGFRLVKLTQMDANKFKKEAFKHAGREFNILSPKQLGEILFTDIGLHIIATTDKGNPSTAKDTLVQYNHPLVTQVLRYRMARKMDGYLRNFINCAKKEGPYWIIHTNQLQHGTITGRFSMTDPPMQTVVALDTGRRSHYILAMRKCFVPRDGNLFYMADYKQLEVKIFAFMAQEKHMLEAINTGTSIHAFVATSVTGITEKNKEEWPHVYKMAKMVTFTLIFGGGVKKIVEVTHEPWDKVESFYTKYHRTFPGVAKFMDATQAFAEKHGFVETHFGRRIPVDRGKAYVGTNYRIQGTASDILKSGVVACGKYYPTAGGFQILNMHDEIIAEVPIESNHVKNVRRVRQILEVWAGEFDMPLTIDMAISASSWADEVKVEDWRASTIRGSITEALRLRDFQRKNPPRLRELRVVR